MYEIWADRMTPTHRSPGRRLGVVLKKEMPLAIGINQSVRIVKPVLFGREVKLRSVNLGISGHRTILWSLVPGLDSGDLEFHPQRRRA